MHLPHIILYYSSYISQKSKRSCIYVKGVSVLPLSTILISIGFWNCSDGVVFIVFHFITTFNNFFNYILTPYLLGSNVLQSSLRSHQVIIIYQAGISIPVNPPPFVGVSRVRALSPAWTGSHARETLISRTHLFLPHDLPPTKKSSTIKS